MYKITFDSKKSFKDEPTMLEEHARDTTEQKQIKDG